jgi:alkaline phosphatase D
MTAPSGDGPSTTRRGVLKAAGATTAAGAAATLFSTGAVAAPTDPRPAGAGDDAVFALDASQRLREEAYPQSVASGDPTTSGAILWTRIAPLLYEENTAMGLELVDGGESGETPNADVDFSDPDARFVIPAEAVRPDQDGTVRVDLDGVLEGTEFGLESAANRFFFFRFVYEGVASPTGRFRTLPEADARVDDLTLAVVSCNNYLHGYFGAYSHVAEEDADYMVHLGDFLYEYAGEGQQVGRDVQLPSGKDVVHTLEDYRHLHQQYRGDEHLQRAMARHTLVHTWDDHEIINNRWWNYENDAPDTRSHPFGGDFEQMRKLYARGIKAMMEYVPLRVDYEEIDDPNEPQDGTAQEYFRLYRSFKFGDLAELFVTDERLYRTRPPEGPDGERRDTATPPSDGQDSATRTMLGNEQKDWFVNGGANPGGLPDTEGVTGTDATWKLWGNEVLNAALKVANTGPNAFYLNYDAWDGYEFERREIVGDIAGSGTENFVTLTGDMHTYVAAYLKLDYEDLTTSEYQSPATDPGGRVGVEFMTPAVTSNNLGAAGGLPAAETEDAIETVVESQNPHVEWFNSSRYGYSVLSLSRDACTYTAYEVDRADPDPSDKRLLRSYRVPEGEVELQEFRSSSLDETVGTLTAGSVTTELDASGDRAAFEPFDPSEVPAPPAGDDEGETGDSLLDAANDGANGSDLF